MRRVKVHDRLGPGALNIDSEMKEGLLRGWITGEVVTRW